MGAMVSTFIRVALQVLAGVGVADLMDKFVKDKVPAYYPEPISPGFKLPRLVWLIVAFGAAVVALKWIGKKTKISILK